MKKKRIKRISFPLEKGDLAKIPRLDELPPEVFEDFIMKIFKNLDKVPLDNLSILVPEMIEVMGPPTKLPPSMALKLVGYVGAIVEWEAKLHSMRTELEKDKKIEKEAKMSIPKGAFVLVLAKDESYLFPRFRRILEETIEVESKFLLPSKMNVGEKVVSEILEEKGVSYSKISLTDEDLRKFYVKSNKAFYVFPSNIGNLIDSKFGWDSFRKYEDLKGRRKEILDMAIREDGGRWEPSEEIKEEIIREMIRNMMKSKK